MPFEPSADIRKQLIDEVVTTCERRFYDPPLHHVHLRKLLEQEQDSLLASTAFSRDLNAVLAQLNTYPVEFGHESERRVGLWKVIQCSFRPSNGGWMFQDVLPDGHADRAGVRPGAQLLAVDGITATDSDIPRFRPTTGMVKVTFRNPRGPAESFEFNAAAKQDDSNTRFVTHKLVEPGIGYIRISKFLGIVGIDVARATDAAIDALRKPSVLIVDMRGNLGSVGAGNLRLMSYMTPDRVPVGYSLTRRRAEQGYRREDLAEFTSIPRWKWLAPFTLWKFKDVDKSIALVTEGLKPQSFHGRIIMLVNEHTISGGEIVAGFASEHKFATLIGTPTAGKLLGFATVPVGHECFFTLPTVNYLTWSGKSFDGSGVIPDIHLPFNPEAAVIRDALQHFTVAGPLGSLLDAETDSLGSGRMLSFETENLLQLDDKAVVPVLLYLFRRIEQRLDGSPTLILLDEAWSYLQHQLFRDRLRDWLKTMRRKNAVVLMATQQISDIANSEIADIVLENCPTKILLPNPEARTATSRVFYGRVGLNEREMEILEISIPKKHYYVVSKLGRRLVDLGVGRVALSWVGVNGREERQVVEAVMDSCPHNWRSEWLRLKGLGPWAQYLEEITGEEEVSLCASA